MERYPVEMAVPTTFAASSFGTCQTPKPSWGIALPSLKPMVGWVDIYWLISFLFYYLLFQQDRRPCGPYRIIIISYVLSRNLMFLVKLEKVWQNGITLMVRQIWYRGDERGACSLLEADCEGAAREIIGSLPLVKAGCWNS